MSNTGFSPASFPGTNIVLAIAYYFGFPALVAISLGAVFWTVVQDVKPRVTAIETILAQQNTSIFARLQYDNQKIITNQETILRRQEDILRAIDGHQRGNEQFWTENRELNHEEIRRLDDIFRQRYGDSGYPAFPKRSQQGRPGER
jgi:hypothetical protein